MSVLVEDTGQNLNIPEPVVKKPKQRLRKSRGIWDILLRGLFSFIFSCSLGLLVIHGSMLWHQYQNGYGFWASTSLTNNIYFFDNDIVRFSSKQKDIFEWNEGQLKVNTSLYAW